MSSYKVSASGNYWKVLAGFTIWKRLLMVDILLLLSCGGSLKPPESPSCAGGAYTIFEYLDIYERDDKKKSYIGSLGSRIQSTYEVDKKSTVSISLERLRDQMSKENTSKCFAEGLSIRARLPRTPPVELPVMNYTVVSNDELKKLVVQVNSENTILGKVDSRDMHMLDLSKSADELRAAIDSLVESPDILANETGEFENDINAVTGARKRYIEKIEELRKRMIDIFFDKRVSDLLPDEELEHVHERTMKLANELGRRSAYLRIKELDVIGVKLQNLDYAGFRQEIDGAISKNEMKNMLGENMEIIRRYTRLDMARRIPDANIRLAAADLHTGDYVDIFVQVVIPKLQGNEHNDDALYREKRFRLRIVDRSFTPQITPQFALIKRLDHPEAQTELRSNYEPAPGAALNFNIPDWSPVTERYITSFGISAFALNFDTETALEIGVAVQGGFAFDYIHAGFGFKLTNEFNPFFFISLDFLKTVRTFEALFL